MESMFRTVNGKMVAVFTQIFSRTCRSCLGLVGIFLLVCGSCSAKILCSNFHESEEPFDFSGFPGVFFMPSFYPHSQNVFFGKEIARLLGEKGKLTYVHLDKEPSVYKAFEINVRFSSRIMEITPKLIMISFVLRSPISSVINKAYGHANLWESCFVIERDSTFDDDLRIVMTQSLEAFLSLFLEQNKGNKNLLFYIPDFA